MTSGNAKGPPRVMIRHTGRPGCFLQWRLGSREGTQPSLETMRFQRVGFSVRSTQPAIWNLQLAKRLRMPKSPTKPVPRSQTAAGMGTCEPT